MELRVGAGVGVLHGDPGAELDMLANCSSERLVIRHARGVQCRQVQLDESHALLLGDTEPAVYVDQVRESEFFSEFRWSAERLSRESCQMIDVGGASPAEERLQQRVGEDARVEDVLQAVQLLFTPGVFVQ
jgi:hypothetical protein